MFSTSGLFKNVPCPGGPDKCKLANCLFSHVQPSVVATTQALARSDLSAGEDHNGYRKRRKLEDGSRGGIGSTHTHEGVAKAPEYSQNPDASEGAVSAPSLPASAVRPISLPPASRKAEAIPVVKAKPSNGTTSQTAKIIEKKVQLTPRTVMRCPTTVMTRLKLLRLLHEEFVRLNRDLADDMDDKISALKLSDNELIRLAVEEEGDVASKQPAVYPNIMRMKYMTYKQMKPSEWAKQRKTVANEAAQAIIINSTPAKLKVEPPVKLDTELSPLEELEMVKRFTLKPEQMEQAGFILTRPTDAQVQESQKTMEATGGYQACERCGSRFQVTPEYQQGKAAIPPGSKCIYHWGKAVVQKREKTDFMSGRVRESTYLCCNQVKGTPGCTTDNYHVYKIPSSDPARMASVFQFEETPANETARKDLAVAFDCEMGYAGYGLELIRVSAVVWPTNEPLLDVLVRPVGRIFDLNTKFSGITPEQFDNAPEFDASKDAHIPKEIEVKDENTGAVRKEKRLKMVSSPAAARSLLYSHISPDTVLIGHAIDNDLNVLRMIHPTIVDTSLLYPHQGGLPFRFPLRKLTKDFLNLEIQTAGAAGHDSMEDSRATGDLVRFKIMREWQSLTIHGWTVKDGKFCKAIEGEEAETPLPPYTQNQGWTKKRKAAGVEGVGGSAGLAQLQNPYKAEGS